MTNCGACIRFSSYLAENMWLGKCPVKDTNVSMSDPSCEAFIDQKMLEIFQKLFIARSDCYAKQTGNGYVKVDSPLTTQVLQRHFRGEITVGAYQINVLDNVKYLAFDLDPEKLENPKEVAKRLLLECTQKPTEKEPRFYPRNVLLESSRFNDPSFHIWVLFAPPIKANMARWLGRKILEHADLSPKSVEVFPKQDELRDNRSFGNFVKLPLGFHQAAKKWSRFLDAETFTPLPSTVVYDVYGCSFPEKDIAKILESTKKREHFQLRLASTSVPPPRMVRTRPCFSEALKDKSVSHEMRVAIVTEFHRCGVSNTSDLVALFRNQSDFDEKTTLYYVNDVVSRKYSRYKCETITNFGYCIGTACPIFLRRKKRFERLVEAL